MLLLDRLRLGAGRPVLPAVQCLHLGINRPVLRHPAPDGLRPRARGFDVGAALKASQRSDPLFDFGRIAAFRRKPADRDADLATSRH
ncbi:hypothetical protein [Sphingomonas sp.]|uniref:hypothetical protein n=1 Tax=Sphingomonas sp. TaxID=28214 RepID=UPI001ECF74E8|nr:hypothetical protein [Sphingomonas sp.]MBX3592841.1 hypothetical protein [Sphingomonas sp.]